MKMYPRVDEYIKSVCSQIKCKEIRDDISSELRIHIEEKIEEYLGLGLSEEAAIDKTLNHMGNPLLIGNQFYNVHKPRTEWGLLTAVTVFVLVGIVVMYSLGASNSLNYYSQFELLANKLVAVALGILFTVSLYFFDYRKLKSVARYLFLSTVIVMAGVIVFGRSVGGRPFLELGMARIDFMSASPYLLLISLAGIFSGWNWGAAGATVRALILFAVPVLLLVPTQSVYAVTLYLIVYLALALTSRPDRSKTVKLLIGTLAIAAAAIFLMFAFFAPNAVERFISFLHPYENPEGAGYQIVQSLEAMRSAGLWGHGFNSGLQQVPGVDTNMVFTYMVYSLGWIFGAMLIVAALFFVAKLVTVATRVRDRFGSLLVTGYAALFAVQFFWNIFMALGFTPLDNATMPFVSHGGSQLILQMVAAGLALSVYRQKNINNKFKLMK